MLEAIRVGLRPAMGRLNLPTVVKTAIPPGDAAERLFVATQPGEIYFLRNGVVETFLNISPRIIRLGAFGGGYDERGLLGLAFHPRFSSNGLFYLHYSVAGTQGPGALPESFSPDPCDPSTLNLKWVDRQTLFDHVDTVEEWMLQPGSDPQRRRTLLNLIRPFMNHNGVNSLNFSPETGKLVLTTGDGGSGYDPFNLSQDDMEIAGKILEIDVDQPVFVDDLPAVTRFSELPPSVQGMLTVIAKGVRNIPGIAFQKINNRYVKYAGNVGQDLVESIFAFEQYLPIPVAQLVQELLPESPQDQERFINFGWRGWEGDLPSLIFQGCTEDSLLDRKSVVYYSEVVLTSLLRIQPLTCYYHQDPRPDKFEGTALTGVQSYLGTDIPGLTGSVVFTDFVRRNQMRFSDRKGVLAYTRERTDCVLSDYRVIEIDYDFGSQPAYFVSLGTNQAQTRLYLGVYGSSNVTDFNLGTVYEVVPV